MENKHDAESGEAVAGAATGSEIHGAIYRELDEANAKLCAENARLRAALEGWVKYFQADIPMTADAQEAQGEEFTRCWFDTQSALSPNDEALRPARSPEQKGNKCQ